MRAQTRRRLRYIWRTVRKGPTEAGYAYFRARRRRRNLADEELDLLPSDGQVLTGDFDVEHSDLEANAELLRSYDERETLVVRTIQWFVPAFYLVYQGGIHTVLRFADHFLREHGVESRLSLFDSDDRAVVAGVERRIASAFPALSGARVTPASARLGPCDAAIATAWESAYPLLRFRDTRAKFFFVQDWDPDFHPAGSLAALMEEAARFGFPGIVNTPALADAYRSLGNPAVSFVPAVDTARYRPSERQRGTDPVRVFFYGRPGNARNGFALGLETLRRVKRRHGERVEIVSAGEDWSPGQYGVADVVKNLGMLEDLDELAELYRSCDIGLVFMLTRHPSYQPLEFMASGMCTVSNVNPWTSWLLRDGENALLSPPLPALVADCIGRLVDRPELRSRISQAGLEQVRATTWEEQIEHVWGAMTKLGTAFSREPETDVDATGARRSVAPRG
jgi:glycosyltransferase involved in cell wall biosynthesis